jgi:hypothetical protein|tara:strand:- start:379 stop:597 length:219 start_codon:yes stop_codon:yes gene_type:complete
MNFKPLFKKTEAMEWTAYILKAVGKAKKYGKPVYLDVGRESTAYMLEDALMQMAMNGESAAWRVEVRLHTLQ